jgi:hypothetical protein
MDAAFGGSANNTAEFAGITQVAQIFANSCQDDHGVARS